MKKALQLSGLRLSDSKLADMRRLSANQREALYELCEHVFLVSGTEESRTIAAKMQNHIMSATRTKDNMFDGEIVPLKDKLARYFHYAP